MSLVDPEAEVRPVKGQVTICWNKIRQRTARNERILVTMLTKRMAEDLLDISPRSAYACATGLRN